ncbi:MAG: hypothetical protein M3O30_11965 [Planctomycetota bacterium]|nr:hypothetical protein [Planctomycetota bacterium]
MKIASGINRRNALDIARSLGCDIAHLRRTGEVLVTHASLPRPIRLNNRRKDAARILTTTLRRLAATV